MASENVRQKEKNMKTRDNKSKREMKDWDHGVQQFSLLPTKLTHNLSEFTGGHCHGSVTAL